MPENQGAVVVGVVGVIIALAGLVVLLFSDRFAILGLIAVIVGLVLALGAALA